MTTGQWRECFLGDVLTLKRGYDLPSSQRRDGSIPIVSSSGVSGFHSVAKARGPGVITGRYGTLGEVFYIEEDFWPLNTTLYVQDFKGNDPRFISYFLRTLDLANQNAAGAVPGVNRNALHMLPVTCPELRVQRRIANILSAYDDLIENNTRRIAILEEMAQAIYREWFVNRRFPGNEQVEMVESKVGPVPAGWEIKNLFDLAEVTYGFAFKSKLFSDGPGGMPVIRIRDIPNNFSRTYTEEVADDRFLVRDGDLLVGMDGDFHRGKWAGGSAYLNQRVARFRPKERLASYHLFLAMQRPIEYFNSTITGTTVAHLGDKHLKEVSLVVPPFEIADRARKLFDPLFALELNLRRRNQQLQETRDLLLPRLISGEVDVGAMAEELAGAAA